MLCCANGLMILRRTHTKIAPAHKEETVRALQATAVAILVAFASAAGAAEIKVISSVGVKLALEKLTPQFEKASGHKLNVIYGTSVPLFRKIEAGETFDAVILTPQMVDDLAKKGRVGAGTATPFAKIGIGVAIKSGAPKPALATADDLKAALTKAKAISYSKEGLSGTVMAKVIDRLGLTAQLKDRTILETRSGMAAAPVAEGKADLGFTLISEILPIQGVQLAGPLPAEVQTYVLFSGGIASGFKDAAAAKALFDFFKSPAARPALDAAGIEPG